MEFKKHAQNSHKIPYAIYVHCRSYIERMGSGIVKINIQTSLFQNNHYCTSLTTFMTILLLIFLQIPFNLYFIAIVVLPACISMYHMYVWHVRKPKGSVRSSQSYKWLWATKWVPGTKLGSYERTSECSSLLSHLHKPLFLYLCISICAWFGEIHHVDPLVLCGDLWG